MLLRPPIAILGVPFDNVTTADAIALIEQMVLSRQPHYLATANVDFLVQALEDVELRRILFDAHLVLCDGTPLLWASRLLGNPLPERVAGSDLVPLLIEVAARKGYRLFFLGATPDSAERAAARLRAQHPDLVIAGHYSPPFSHLLEMNHDEIKQQILAAKPDLLFVSLGCPKQEKWIAMHYRSLGVPVSAGVGATIDFLAGQVKRAPRWMQRSGTEWIFRLLQEPRRLFRRYLKDLWAFGRHILPQWWHLQFRGRKKSRPGQSSGSARRLRDDATGIGQAIDPGPSPLNQSRDKLPQFQTIRFPERLDLAAVQSSASLVEQIHADRRPCLLVMGHVQFIDSTGVGLLISLQKQLSAANRQLILLAPSNSVRRALALMRLEGFFASADDLASAQQLLLTRAREQSAAVTSRTAVAFNPLLWQGEITAANAQAVWERTQAQVMACTPRRDVIIDLSGVRFIDSTGLGLMVRAKKLARDGGANLLFTALPPPVHNVIRIARLEEFLLR
jgi:N-acetylglucosaminyldiphosphoundecaprenol N-acetyl-beta-D-mannosaminyltransferase